MLLTWNDPYNHDPFGFRIYRDGNILDSVSGSATSYSDQSVACGVNYSYQIQAYNECGDGALSTPKIGWTTCGPAQVTGVVATDNGCGLVNVVWTDLNGELGYKVFRNGAQIGTSPANTPIYADASGTPGFHYAYSVLAYNSCGDGPMSATDTGWQSTVGQVTNVTANSPDGCPHIVLTWSDLSSELGYKIFRSGVQLASVTANITSYVDTSGTCGQSYDYGIQAFDACGSGPTTHAWLNWYPCGLEKVSGVMASSGLLGKVSVSWTALAGVAGYKVYRDNFQINEVGQSTRNIDDTAIYCGVRYAYSVRAFDHCGDAPLSDVASGYAGCNTEVRIDSVGGLVNADTARAGDTLRFYIGFVNRHPSAKFNLSSGFLIYGRASLDSGARGSGTATWLSTPPTNRPYGWSFSSAIPRIGPQVDTTGRLSKADFGMVFQINCFNCDGQGIDTVGFAAFASDPATEHALPSMDSVTGMVVWLPTRLADSNKVICIDSTMRYPPTNTWKWFPFDSPGAKNEIPSWSSTRCYVLSGRSCCTGLTGNVDCDRNNGVDISDLSALVDHLYIGFSPLCCTQEANIDGSSDGNIDISDLTRLVDFLYISFQPPASCR